MPPSSRLKNGTLWRQTAFGGGVAIYSEANQEDAEVFDRIINTIASFLIPFPLIRSGRKLPTLEVEIQIAIPTRSRQFPGY